MSTKPGMTRREAAVSLGACVSAVMFPQETVTGAGNNERARFVVLNPYGSVDWGRIGTYKAALHVHTLQSDGSSSVSQVVDAYRRAGYTILSITDHDWDKPNARIEWKLLPPEKASPYPLEPRPYNYPANTTWPWSDYGCAEPKALGVVGIQGSELSFRHHINSYFNDYGVWYEKTGESAPYGGIVDLEGREIWEDDQLLAIRDRGGLAILNHPGIPDEVFWWQRKSLRWYVSRFQRHSSKYLIGIEVTNNVEPRYRAYDEGLWDQLLARFMPHRPIWGFGTDDMHELERSRQSFTVFFLDELTDVDVRQAMELGRFCFCRSTKDINYLEDATKMAVFPMLTGVSVDEAAGTIRIQTTDCDEVKWFSAPQSPDPVESYVTSDRPWPLGQVVHVGESLDFHKTLGILNYVRAELSRREGDHTHRTFTNPFGIGNGAKS